MYDAMIRSVTGHRDKLMVMFEGLLGLSANDLRRLTFRQAAHHLKARHEDDTTGRVGQVAHILAKYRQVRGADKDDYLFLSKRSDRHASPLGRHGIYRVLRGALRAVFGPRATSPLRTLQSIATALTGLPTHWHMTGGADAPVPLSDGEMAMLALGLDPAPG
jgi:hypothetical protein